jgi:hypothetical protein
MLSNPGATGALFDKVCFNTSIFNILHIMSAKIKKHFHTCVYTWLDTKETQLMVYVQIIFY